MSQAVAERYGRALFEIGNETQQLAQISDQIRKMAELYADSEDLRRVLRDPTLADDKRDGLIKDVGARLGMSQHAVSAVRLLASRRRLGALPEIATELRRLADESAGIVRATVVSAKPLSEAYYRELTQKLEQLTSRKIVLEKAQDPTLISGIVTKIGDRTIDGSLKGRLATLQRELTPRS